MHRRYENPPVVEAICEFSFEPGQPWDGTLPGLIYNEIKEKFPKKQQQTGLGIGIQFAPPNPGLISTPVRREMFSRLRFLSEDERTLVQIAPDLLTINKLKPYSSWNNLKPLILYTLEKYEKVARPKAIRHIGVRYINRIEIPVENVRVDDYIGALPTIPEQLPQEISAWMLRTEIPVNEGLLIIQSGTLREAGQHGIVVMLDLNFIIAEKAFPTELAEKKIEVGHKNLGVAFEACISDAARALFKEVA